MSRHLLRFVLTALAVSASPAAMAADTLKFGSAPSWVVPTKVPGAPTPASDAPIVLLLSDQQLNLEHGKTTMFSQAVFKIQTAQGLSAGNLSIPWNPTTDTVTINRLSIRRGEQVIDVLASQQFTTIRRESNLEVAMLDGRLTATIQPEGLREGDIIDFAATVEQVDPVMKGHVEAEFATWNGTPIGLGHARMIWPADMKLRLRQSDDLPKPTVRAQGGKNVAELTLENIQPLMPPTGSPPRFQLGRIAEATDFASWSEIADLFVPLYRVAAIVPPTGSLREEVERIRKESADPAVRAEKALVLVQDRVRYVALFMADGGYIPTPAETTWARRFGDCKGKTALLIAILHELGIDAVPVAVHSNRGDALPDRLPMLSLFNHVLVRARIGNKDYWLDGTRTGDSDLGRLQVPGFRWGLPLVAKAELVSLVPAPLAQPDSEQLIEIDAQAGVYAPSAVTIERIYRGDGAILVNSLYAQLTTVQRDELIRQNAKQQLETMVTKSSSIQFDKAKAELSVTVKGEAKLKWDDGWYFVPSSTVGYAPNFDRAVGPHDDAPLAIAYPSYSKERTIIHLPPGFLSGQKKLPPVVKETLAGVEYERSVTTRDNSLIVEVKERSLTPELPYDRAKADEPRLRAIYDEDVYLKIPNGYRGSEKDVAAMVADKPASASAFFDRGLILLNHNRLDEAIGDFTESLKLDPTDAWTLANRGIAHVWKHDFSAAEKDLAAAEAIDADNPVAIRARALAAELKGDLSAAIEAYSKSLRKNRTDAFALAHRGMALMMQGKADDAMRDLNEAVKADASGPTALAARAIANAIHQDFAAAEKDAAQALAQDANNVQALLARAMSEQGQGEAESAAASYSKVLQIDPGNPMALVQRATAWRALGDDAKALADTEAALKAGAVNTNVRLMRANIFRKQGNREAAIGEAKLLIEENPKSDFAQVAAARIYSSLGMKREAMQAFDAAIAIKPAAYVYLNRAQSRPVIDREGRASDLDAALKLEPDNPDVLAMKAQTLSQDGKFAEAIQLYDQILTKEPGDKDSLAISRAVALYKAGRTAEAEKAFADIRSKAKLARDYNNLCWQQATSNFLLESALADCREALRLEPETGSYLDSLGMVLLRLGKLDEALIAYDRAIARNAGSSSFMGRALVHLRKGDKSRAEADRAEAVKLDPDVESRFSAYGLKL